MHQREAVAIQMRAQERQQSSPTSGVPDLISRGLFAVCCAHKHVAHGGDASQNGGTAKKKERATDAFHVLPHA